MRLHARTKHVVFIAGLAALVLATGPGRAQDDVGEKQRELDRIKKEIQDHRNKSKQLGSREQQELKKLQSLDKEIDLTRRYVKKLSEQEEAIDRRIGELRVQIGGREIQLSHQEEVLGRRIRELYKQDPRYQWEILLGSQSMDDAVRRYQFTKLVAEQDARLIGEVRESRQQLLTESSRLTQSLEQIAAVRADRETESSTLEVNKKKRQTMLTQIRSEKGKHTKAIADLEKAQAQLQNLLEELQRRGTAEKDLPPTGEFASMKGRLIWPVAGKVIRGFGKHTHPRYGTVTMNNGLDIAAPAGAPIVAVAAGVVEFVDWIDAFGKCVILNHGGGYYTLYAHVAATSVAQGQKVGRGQVIAEVGDTGSLDGYICHFEVRQARKALNPAEWLTKKASS